MQVLVGARRRIPKAGFSEHGCRARWKVREMVTVKGRQKWMWTATVIVLLYCDQLTNLCPREKPHSSSETLTMKCAVYWLRCEDNTRSQITTMRGDNPIKEIGGGQWDSSNTYHTRGTTKLTSIYRQTNALIPVNPIRALKSSGVSKTVCLRNPNMETLHFQSPKQDNDTKPNSKVHLSIRPCKHFD